MMDLFLAISLAVVLFYLGGLIDLTFMELDAQKEANQIEEKLLRNNNVRNGFNNNRTVLDAGRYRNLMEDAGQTTSSAVGSDYGLTARGSPPLNYPETGISHNI